MAPIAKPATHKPLLGIGSCLAGNAVRYDGDTGSANQYVQAIREQFDTRAFCPEMGIGLGVPRPPIHLVGSADQVRVLDVETHSRDYTGQIEAYARRVLEAEPQLCGYILVKDSPSCGYGRVKRYSGKGNLLAADQDGIFAAALATANPQLPLADDGGLRDPGLRESFISRARTYHAWQVLQGEGLSTQRLTEFYSRYKYLAMAHSIPDYRKLGALLTNPGQHPIETLAQEFIATLMNALGHRATRRSHSNVLRHIARNLQRHIPERRRLSLLIEEYRTGHVPLTVPVTMLRHHFADKYDAYINGP